MIVLRKTVCIIACSGIFAYCIFGCNTPERRHSLDHPHLRRFTDHHINQIIITAWEHFSLGNFESSALDFERLIIKDYSDDDILFGASFANFRLNNKKKALEFCTKAIEKNPLHFEAIFLRANIFRDLGKIDAARKDLQTIISMEFEKNLVCGYYFYQNDIADKKAFEAKKSQAFLHLKNL